MKKSDKQARKKTPASDPIISAENVGSFQKLGHGNYKESDVAATLRANNGDAHSSDLIVVQVVSASASDVVEEAETYTDRNWMNYWLSTKHMMIPRIRTKTLRVNKRCNWGRSGLGILYGCRLC